MKPRRRLLVALATASALTAAAMPAHADSAKPRFSEYVALGDSWSADVTVLNVATEHAPVGCAQSTWNYPKQVAEKLGVTTFRDATCGAATTVHLTASQDVNRVPVLADGVNDPQFDRLTPTTDLVTMGMGGNDVGLAAAIGDCVSLLPTPLAKPCRAAWESGGKDLMSERIVAAQPKIVAAVDGIKRRSPGATVLVVDYLAGISPDRGCFPYVQMLDTDLRWFGARLVELNAMLGRAARESGAGFVDTYSASVGHDVCRAPGVKWVEGLIPVTTNPPGLAVPFHPNKLGADHQARAVLAAVGS
ncbi:SGNH/GDSL hydrolase family protein [Streptomyces sp. 21So2-11]|uniref:SGNH/GDSL hydrolase family protein n=1 Tax=Streptomyces sp. 21So2-11 TaxID=3144408 RepID=UPI00321AABDA